MRAVLALPAGSFGLVETPAPDVRPGEILVEMRACGLCGTDLAKLAQPGNGAGVRLGHEIAGIVRSVGTEVTRFAPGDRVTAGHHVPCGDCWACRHGNESMCPQFKATNFDPCGFAELIRIPRLHVERVTHRLPDDLSDEEASFTEPLACAVRAVERSRALPGDRIAVIGGGGMGLLIAQALLARAAEPLLLEVAESRLELARSLGIACAVNPVPAGVQATLAKLTGGAGADGAILTVVTAKILAEVQGAIRPGGRINIFADAADGPTLPLDFADIYRRELAVFSTYSSTPETLDQALALLAGRRVRVAPLISHRLPLGAFAEGVRLQREGRALKVVFHP